MSLIDLQYNVLGLFAPIFLEIEFKNDLKDEFKILVNGLGNYLVNCSNRQI